MSVPAHFCPTSSTALETQLKRLEKHAMNVSDVAWSADSTALLSASFDASCIVWDVDSGKALSVHKTDSFVQCATFNPAST